MTFVARLLLGVAAVRWALTELKYLFLSLISNVCNDIGYWLFEVVKKNQNNSNNSSDSVFKPSNSVQLLWWSQSSWSV